MIHAIGHLMNLCVLSSNRMVQKKQIPDPSLRLFKDEPNGSPPIMTLHMNTFARNDKNIYMYSLSLSCFVLGENTQLY